MRNRPLEMREMAGMPVNRAHKLFSIVVTEGPHAAYAKIRTEGGRNGFDGIESRWEGVPGSELP